MKISTYILIVCILDNILRDVACLKISNYLSVSTSTTLKVKMHLEMMRKVKKHKNQIFKNLYSSSNSVNYNQIQKPVEAEYESITRTSDPNSLNQNFGEKFRQYEYLSYHKIIDELYEMKKINGTYIDITTAQQEFGLPSPGGECRRNINTPEKCFHYIVKLTNFSSVIPNKNKPTIYFSGEVHGDERVGPTSMVELIRLFLRHRDEPLISHLLNTRLVIITPMTNPHGYHSNIREELLIENENQVLGTKTIYNQIHKDINRDFPYLVNPSSCMQTIGARVINELFLKYNFILSLSLHGGTQSLTYAYGTPNHINGNEVIEMNYSPIKENKMLGKKVKNISLKIAKQYRNGEYEEASNSRKSNNPPDLYALQSIANTSLTHSKGNSNEQIYKTGDMNTIVYPVEGGMEDWAYSASWEGSPIITQPCLPTTYSKYPYKSSRTIYDNFFPDAMRNMMFLLETSHDKTPEQKELGYSINNCILNMKRNAFFNQVHDQESECSDPNVNGYIPKILRISLTLIDMLDPYINYRVTSHNASSQLNYKLEWLVGGSIEVDNTSVYYNIVEKNNKPINNKEYKTEDEIKKDYKNHSVVLKGNGIWSKSQKVDPFNFEFSLNDKQEIHFLIIARVDGFMKESIEPDPNVPPQSHFVNLRKSFNYQVGNEKTEVHIKGKEFIYKIGKY